MKLDRIKVRTKRRAYELRNFVGRFVRDVSVVAVGLLLALLTLDVLRMYL